MNVIEINKLSFSYEKLKKRSEYLSMTDKMVLNEISLNIAEGETVGIIGRNGVGKSTLLKILVGIENGDTEKIKLFSKCLQKKNLAEIRRRIGYVFQDSDSQLFMSTVYEDVAFGPQNYGYSAEEVEKRTRTALEKVHMTELAEKRIYQLSGGEKKLAAIATVLPLDPDIILLDEPSVALDPQNRRNLIRILNEISMTKVIASHDLDFIYDTCERTILLNQGKIVADGKTKEILQNKELLEKNGLELPLSFSRNYSYNM